VKSLTVRLPDALVPGRRNRSESRRRKLAKSDVVRERLMAAGEPGRRQPALLHAIADVIGSVDDGLPRDLSARTKTYLKSTGYGGKRKVTSPRAGRRRHR
jgi:hypothetical protein